MYDDKNNKKCAFITIVGKPNVGKSTILNCMVGQKIAIVSPKAQTTRNRIMGIVTINKNQLVFIDTPGMHSPKNKLGNFMVNSISKSMIGVDLHMMVIEAYKDVSDEEMIIIDKIKQSKLPSILVINKIDLVKDKSVLLKQIKEYSEIFDFDDVIPISAKTGDGLIDLKKTLINFSKQGEHYFSEDDITDQPERVMVSEIIREKVLKFIDKEIPHGIAVQIEKMSERERNDIIDINAVIYCEKAGHKSIIIGKDGSMLKKIGSCARKELENFFDCKINLQLWVKVKQNWRNNNFDLKNFGYDKKDINL